MVTSVGANNGTLFVYLDGVQVHSATGIDNDQKKVDNVFWGGFFPGTGVSGVFYLDEMKWSDGAGAPPWIVPAAAQGGTYGMAITPFADTTGHYGEFTGPSAENYMTIEFDVDPNGLTMTDLDVHKVMWTSNEIRVDMRINSGSYQLRAVAILDSGTSNTSYVTITDANSFTSWYIIYDGVKWSANKVFSGTTGTIDKSIWDSLIDGDLVIRFYASDTLGNIAYYDRGFIKGYDCN